MKTLTKNGRPLTPTGKAPRPPDRFRSHAGSPVMFWSAALSDRVSDQAPTTDSYREAVCEHAQGQLSARWFVLGGQP